eukprot:CAMPEP_0119572174 /NCGR_PEP_ID=MMETSP1352-20130426/44484_1 /TAXON_ID=265584 /ORGANISM="Stauroneis constricta, Strain CCMP1120" /LENGTH=405 /DNA_ID=CAMNT_0007621859 /DNA_START=1243 /DNA_END=2460 /DNA_ORIENTATION=+
MVSDLRVSSLLSRLGGLYRDPSRVDRDASSLIKSAVGLHLVPGIAPLVENNGNASNCLVLQGTISIVYLGQTYQQLVDIYLPPSYPRSPPVTYVRLAPGMYMKENHKHVGGDGMVYMPYTHEWNAQTHSLIEMVMAMSSVFSASPPVFSKPAEAPAPAAADPPPTEYTSSIFQSTQNNGSSIINNNTTSLESERYIQEQMQAILAREAEEANRAANIARQAAREDEERAQRAAKELEQKQRKAVLLRSQLNSKIADHLSKQAKQTKVQLEGDWRDQFRLEETKENIQEELEFFRKTKQDLEEKSKEIDNKTEEIKAWLEETKNSPESKEVDVDDLCQPTCKLYAQMMELSAKNAALTDALYFLDRAMYAGQLDCTTHLKSVRKLAKQQFSVRAHLIKINQAILDA